MTDKKPFNESGSSIIDEIISLIKTAFGSLVKQFNSIRGIFTTKSDMLAVMSNAPEEGSSMKKKSKKENQFIEALDKIPSSITVAEHTKSARQKLSLPERAQIAPINKAPVEMPSVTSAVMPEPVAKPKLKEPDSVWVGEEGPDLPGGYGITVMRALPRDPHWAYLYWEISEAMRSQICNEEGEWYFDVSESYLRVLNEKGDIIQETPVVLDANSWYLNLAPNQKYEFELGLKNKDGVYRSLVRSNCLALPPMEPSSVTDEEWAVVSEEFEEVFYNAAGLEISTSGASPSMGPHVLRHRMRVPWKWNAEQFTSSHEWPSSQVFPSSRSMIKMQ